VKIFVSYSRRDAGDFANQIQRHFSSFNYDIFTDVDDIRAGEIWIDTIETNISNCDIFVVIVTDGALHSPHVANEVLQAQGEKKTIIPCFHRSIRDSDIKWGLEKIQGVEFDDKYELTRSLYSMISYKTFTKHSDDSYNIRTTSAFSTYPTQIDKNSSLEHLTEGKSISMHKIFLSYAREDTDFAHYLHQYLKNKSLEVFIDVDNISIGEPWSDSIEKNISDCDIFLVILTYDSLSSRNVENEVYQAQQKNKIIVPCIHQDLEDNDIKWGLGVPQGIKFSDEYKLARNLYSKIKKIIKV
jgi:TIR domain